MFNGIVEELGKITSVRDIGGGKELVIACRMAPELEVDNSLCVNGVCQTVVRQNNDHVSVQVIEETLSKTSLGDLRSGSMVNLERSLSLSQRIDGHIVQGHVDTTGEVLEVGQEGTNWLYTIGYDPRWRDLVVGRGSIAVDGISLTIAREKQHHFAVAIIPYTYQNTVIKNRRKGDRVNLEFDILGKYVLRFMENHHGSSRDSRGEPDPETGNRKQVRPKDQTGEYRRTPGGVSEQMLRDSGFTD